VAPAAAGPAASYGKNFVRLGLSWQDESPPTTLLAPVVDAGADADESGAGYLQQLQQLELTQGPYADSLAEPLMDLGRLHLDAGQFEQAGQLYRRALHVVRINDGLQSERQLPLVQSLLTVHRGLGDWQGLDQRYEYYHRIAGDPQDYGIGVTLEYFRWQREALRRQLDGNPHRRLLRLYEQNAQLLEGAATGAEGSLSVAEQWQLVASQLRNLYLIQVLVQPRLDTRVSMTASPFYQQQQRQQELDIHEQRLLNIQRTAVSEGAALLQDFIAGAGPGNEVLQAHAWLEMADWHQWNGSWHRASEDYAGLAGHLLDTGQGALLREWFAEPVELPDNGVFLRDPGRDFTVGAL
jgi:tetratricopeptide (TPR) repeat protein